MDWTINLLEEGNPDPVSPPCSSLVIIGSGRKVSGRKVSRRKVSRLVRGWKLTRAELSVLQFWSNSSEQSRTGMEWNRWMVLWTKWVSEWIQSLLVIKWTKEDRPLPWLCRSILLFLSRWMFHANFRSILSIALSLYFKPFFILTFLSLSLSFKCQRVQVSRKVSEGRKEGMGVRREMSRF